MKYLKDRNNRIHDLTDVASSFVLDYYGLDVICRLQLSKNWSDIQAIYPNIELIKVNKNRKNHITIHLRADINIQIAQKYQGDVIKVLNKFCDVKIHKIIFNI